jgi:hypothetical protein
MYDRIGRPRGETGQRDGFRGSGQRIKSCRWIERRDLDVVVEIDDCHLPSPLVADCAKARSLGIGHAAIERDRPA